MRSLLIVLAILAALPVRAEITVFAAASLKGALDEAAAAWTAETGDGVRLSFAASSALARQIQQGAEVDLFISANADWMNALEASGDIAPETRRELLANTLVLIGNGDIAPFSLEELPSRLGGKRLAMGLVNAVPAGVYGKAAFETLGLWADLRARIAQTDNVRAALSLVARGEAPFGVVYATDAAAEPAVSVVWTFPPESHPRLVYPAAVPVGGTGGAFLDWLTTAEGRAPFLARGFRVPE